MTQPLHPADEEDMNKLDVGAVRLTEMDVETKSRHTLTLARVARHFSREITALDGLCPFLSHIYIRSDVTVDACARAARYWKVSTEQLRQSDNPRNPCWMRRCLSSLFLSLSLSLLQSLNIDHVCY